MKPENNIDNLISMMKAGKTVSDITFERDEAEAFIPIIKTLSSLPKASLPVAYREHRYAEALKPKSFFKTLVFFVRASAVPISVVAGLVLFVGTGYAAQSSIPGQNLFIVKKSLEQTSLIFTPEAQKPQARLALTEKRLAEAEQVLTNPNNDPESTKAVLEELNEQAQNTFSDVRKIADTKDLSDSEVKILSSLDEITKKQEVLANTIQPTNEQITEIKDNATKDAKESNENINRLIATINEKTLAELKDPNEIAISGGTISSISNSRIIVERTSFIIDPKTIAIFKDDQPFELSKLTAKSKVTIVGTKTGNNITAKTITIIELLEIPVAGTVKGDATGITPTPTPANTDPKEEPEQQPTTPTNNVNGTFIPEQP
ncbi:MAG: hypothetical protein IT410_00970 [Candidatus Doudnabacteria bacterium]|nr:hypothetical protein [Candidatus Doudnabacteria bacterium]